jgi:hypothetical protein
MAFGDLMKNLEGGAKGLGLGNLPNIGDLGSLLGGDFLSKFTKFGSLQGLLSKVGAGSPAELAKVDPAKLDSVVKENSSFSGFTEMLAAAKEKIGK